MNKIFYLLASFLIMHIILEGQQAAISSSSPQANPASIKLISNSNAEFYVPRTIALQSRTLEGLALNPITNEPVSEIPFKTISSENLAIVARIMNFMAAHPNLLGKDLMNELERQLPKEIVAEPLKLIDLANFFDFKPLMQLVASLITRNPQLRTLIPNYLRSEQISQSFKTELAHYYFNPENPSPQFGCSIQDYLDFQPDKIRKRFSTTMQGPSFSGLPINNLLGLKNIPTLAQMNYLDLRGAQLKEIPATAFAGMNNVQTIILRNNPIERIDPTAFTGLTRLEFIDLAGTRLSDEQKKQLRNALSPKIRIEF